MKKIIMSLLTLTSLCAFADNIVKCSDDRRPVDGALKELIITKNAANNYTYVLTIVGSGMAGPYQEIVSIESSNCDFSKKIEGVGQCYEATKDGFRGKNRLSIARTFELGTDQLTATSYKGTTKLLEISFDLSDCQITL